MVYNHHISPRQPKPKKPQSQIDKERNSQLLDLIQASGKDGISLFNLKRNLGWGDGIFQRRVKDLKEGFTGEVQYVKKDKKFIPIYKSEPFTKEALQEWNKEPKETRTVSEQNYSILT